MLQLISSEFLKACSIAVVEGLTEFIPVSSTGHMILLGHFIEFVGPKAATFQIFIQSGAILAVVFIYHHRFRGLIPSREVQAPFVKQLLTGRQYPNGMQILLSILPIMVAGALFHRVIKQVLFHPLTVSAGLIIGGILMILVECRPGNKPMRDLPDITFRQAFLIGLGQCFALWPGMSRSGSTMIAGLYLGIRHKSIADFSFIIAVPVMLAAVCFDILKSLHHLSLADVPVFSAGFLIAFLVAWGSIKWFLSVLTRLGLVPFGFYRIGIGLIGLWLFA